MPAPQSDDVPSREPAYVSIAGDYARRIRGGELPPETQLPSYPEIAQKFGVSEIVVRKAIELLQSQGLIRSVRRRGNFVADRPMLVRVSPDRQLEDPEDSFGNEATAPVLVERAEQQIPATAELANLFDIAPGDSIVHTITKASEGDRPISISDTYQPLDAPEVEEASHLEETVADRLPAPHHAAWLRTTAGDLVKEVHQRFTTPDGRVIMVSNVSYPRDRYDAFKFRMVLDR